MITPDAWAALKLRHPEEELAVLLNQALGVTPVPYPEIQEKIAVRAFARLKGASLASLFDEGPIDLLRTSEQADQPGYHLALHSPGTEASNYLFCRARWATAKANSPSVEQRWNDPALRLKVCRRFFKLKACGEVSPSYIRRALCVTGATPTQFKPGVARAVYELLGARRVLDFSAGWGDRLVGFCASPGTETYLGVDPNADLHPLYDRAALMYGIGKKIRMMCAPAEDAAIEPGSADVVFTSPPYFGMERYAAGSAHAGQQSWSRYPTGHSWRSRFLEPVLRKSWDALVPGGFLVLNIADVRQDGEDYPLCRWTREIVGRLPDARFRFVLGMRLQGSNYAAEARSRKSGEPVWVWSKGEPGARLPVGHPGRAS